MVVAGQRPTGTVSFLFTDIEGSTQLWDTEPEAMARALEEHDAIVSQAILDAGGVVFATGGDGFCVAFDAAGKAIAAAVDAQRQLLAHSWPADCVLRVRMGIHTGEAVERAGDYFGPAVNLAARVMSAAHGGQIVCTDVVADLTSGALAALSLGEHELRGVAAAIRIHQVVADGLPADFGPLRTLESVRTNLPYELTAPLGRQELVAEVAELAKTGRLVTLTGVGGVGKTTVAFAAGRQLLDEAKQGVWLVELAAVTRPELIPEAVAAALRFSPPGGMPLRDALVAYLQGRELVLLMDNCEQIVDAMAETVRWLLAACASVRVLATSREALRVPGEHVVAVPPLDVPAQDSATDVLAAAAGELFLSRAVEAGAIWRLDERNAPAVAQLCRRLDGVPLALELAAARSAQLSVESIASRLGAHLDVLSGRRSGEARHRSLVAALEWSYELLAPGEQNLLRQLAVFVDGFDVDGVVAIAGAAGADEWEALDGLSSLVAKSLVERDPMITGRYRLLETIRAFSAALGQGERTGQAHAEHYLGVLREAFHQLRTTDGVEATELLVADAANVEAALGWCLDVGSIEQALELFEVMPGYATMALPASVADGLGRALERLVLADGAQTFHGFSAACSAAVVVFSDSPEQAKLPRIEDASRRVPADPFTAIGEATLCGGKGDMAGGSAASLLALQQLGDADDPVLRSILLANVAVFNGRGDPAVARPAAEEALSLARANCGVLVQLYALLATAMARWDDPQKAVAAADEARRLDRGVRRPFSGQATVVAAMVAADAGDLVSALTLTRQSLVSGARAGNRYMLGLSVAAAANMISGTNPHEALRLICLAESGAIAKLTVLDNEGYSNMLQLSAEADPAELEAMRARFAELSYDEAVQFVLTTLDDVAESISGPAAD
jgi:predicted ATPase/class 3 adenylate cyclase